MTMKIWVAAWTGLVILGACDANDGDFERAGEELDNRVERTVDAAKEVERDLNDVADDIEERAEALEQQ